MKITLLILAGLLALAAVIVLIGALLPRDHTASRRTDFKQTPEVLYGVARDFAAHPQWRTGLQSVELLAPEAGQLRYRETSAHGAVIYRVLEERTAERLVVEIADENLPWGGKWTIEFARHAGGASVRITENGFVKNPAFRFLARFVFGHTTTMEHYLRDLGRKFGETVQPQP